MPRLPASWADHFDKGLSHRLGGSHADGRPEICRGLAGRLLADGRIEVLVDADAGEWLLAAVAATGRVSYVTAQPTTHRTLHLKGMDAVIDAAEAVHWPVLELARDRFLAEVEPFGFSRERLRAAWFSGTLERLRQVRFTPFGAWDQTPGPGAGTPLELLP